MPVGHLKKQVTVSELKKWHQYFKKYNPLPWLSFKDESKNLDWSDIAKMYGVKE